MNTWEGGVDAPFGVLEEAEMWLSKVSRLTFKSNAISNIFIRFCIRCNYLYGAWVFWFLGKWKGWKPLLRLGFQPLLSSVKVRYFLLKSDGVLRLENRLPKRHGGSHTAGTEYTTRNRVFAVSASRGDIGLNLYSSGTISTNLTPSSIPLFQDCSINWTLLLQYFLAPCAFIAFWAL